MVQGIIWQLVHQSVQMLSQLIHSMFTIVQFDASRTLRLRKENRELLDDITANLHFLVSEPQANVRSIGIFQSEWPTVEIAWGNLLFTVVPWRGRDEYFRSAASCATGVLPDGPGCRCVGTQTFLTAIQAGLNQRKETFGGAKKREALQYRQLGIPRFAELYVSGFLNGGSYEAIPLEVKAYTLDGRFESDQRRMFSVEDEVGRWAAEGRL
jgi:hypothetical protein